MLALLGLLVSGGYFYAGYDAISTGSGLAGGRFNSHYVTRASNPEGFHSLVKGRLGLGVFFMVIGIGAYILSGREQDKEAD
jgi:hypothetical protein